MAIIGKPDHEYPWYIRWMFNAQKKKYGKVLESAKVWARSPRLFLGIATIYGGIDRKSNPISPVLRSLITVFVSQINHCSFCVDLNSSIVLERGGAMDKVNALKNYKDSDLFTEQEKIAFEYAEAITYTDKEVDQDLRQRLLNFYDEDTIVELTGLIAFQNLSTKFNNALDIQPQGFCVMPKS